MTQRKVKTRVRVEQDEEVVVERGVLAEAILKISAAMTALKRGGINHRAIVVLVQDGCRGVGQMKLKPTRSTVDAVLNSLEDLKRTHCS